MIRDQRGEHRTGHRSRVPAIRFELRGGDGIAGSRDLRRRLDGPALLERDGGGTIRGLARVKDRSEGSGCGKQSECQAYRQSRALRRTRFP